MAPARASDELVELPAVRVLGQELIVAAGGTCVVMAYLVMSYRVMAYILPGE